MKKLVILLAVVFSGTVAMAQTNPKTYGPKAKNERVWVNKTNKSEVVTNNNEHVTGGKAKNNQVWAKNYNASETNKVTGDADKLALKGPAAKNNTLHKKRMNQIKVDTLNTNLAETGDKKEEAQPVN